MFFNYLKLECSDFHLFHLNYKNAISLFCSYYFFNIFGILEKVSFGGLQGYTRMSIDSANRFKKKNEGHKFIYHWDAPTQTLFDCAKWTKNAHFC